jgi:hypothetical protein
LFPSVAHVSCSNQPCHALLPLCFSRFCLIIMYVCRPCIVIRFCCCASANYIHSQSHGQ